MNTLNSEQVELVLNKNHISLELFEGVYPGQIEKFYRDVIIVHLNYKNSLGDCQLISTMNYVFIKHSFKVGTVQHSNWLNFCKFKDGQWTEIDIDKRPQLKFDGKRQTIFIAYFLYLDKTKHPASAVCKDGHVCLVHFDYRNETTSMTIYDDYQETADKLRGFLRQEFYRQTTEYPKSKIIRYCTHRYVHNHVSGQCYYRIDAPCGLLVAAWLLQFVEEGHYVKIGSTCNEIFLRLKCVLTEFFPDKIKKEFL